MFNDRRSVGETYVEALPLQEIKTEEIQSAIKFLNRKLNEEDVIMFSEMLGIETYLV